MRVLSLDPGETTGLAVVELNGKIPTVKSLRESKDSTLKDCRDLFESVDRIIYETFFVDPGKAKQGAFDNSPMKTIKIIGVIEILAEQNGVPLIPQNRSVKPMGYAFAGLQYVKGKKGMHMQDALAHAMFHLVTVLQSERLKKKT